MQVTARLSAFALMLLLSFSVQAQDSLNVTFRFIPSLNTPAITNVQRAFVPGTFNDWGPNASGRIQPTAPSLMTFNPALNEHRYTVRLRVGSTHRYKIHYHTNATGSTNIWLSDPLNPVTVGQNADSEVQITDPMIFQLAREERASGAVQVVSASVFGTAPITSLRFEVNGEEQDGMPHFDAQSGIFRYTLPNSVAPGSQFAVSITDSRGRTSRQSIGTIPPVVTREPRPAGLRDGITYVEGDPTRVRLSLYAPHKQYVYVLGDFNNWQTDERYLMKREDGQGIDRWFWLEIDGLTPGQEYAFQYYVDGLIRVADPYSEKVLDPFHDGSIGATRYPGLKAYPAGRTSGIVGVLQPGRTPFQWQNNDWVRPPQGELVIYELLIRDFVAQSTFETMIDTLSYLKNLGINAIQLMPISEFDGNLSWGYNPAFYFAVDKYYGPADSFRRFVDAAHGMGMAVILDVVYNHATGQSPLIRMWNNSPTGDPGGSPTSINPYANTSARHPFNVFNDLNHESPALQYMLDRVNRYWIEEFRVDGYRFDLSKGFTQVNSGSDVGAWGRYDQSRVNLLGRMADRVWEFDPTAYLILEHFGDNQEEQVLANYRVNDGKPGFMLWHNLNFPYSEAVMGYNSNSNLSGSYFGTGGRGFARPNAVAYMESHDEQWIMFKARQYAACSNFPAGGPNCTTNPGEYSARELRTALERMKTAGSFFFTMPGPKMLWQFGELGYGGGVGECLINDGSNECPTGTPGRTSAKPIRWEYRADPDRFRLYQTWSALLNLRAEQPIFRSNATQVLALPGTGNLKRAALRNGDLDAIVIGNFGLTTANINAAFTRTGTWYDYFGNREVNVTDNNTQVSLRPGEFRVLTSNFVGYAPFGLLTNVESEPLVESATFTMDSLYPNPLRESGVLRFQTPEAGAVRVAVYDLLGREVVRLADDVLPAGNHSLVVDAQGLTSGLYLVRVNANGQTLSQPLTVVR